MDNITPVELPPFPLDLRVSLAEVTSVDAVCDEIEAYARTAVLADRARMASAGAVPEGWRPIATAPRDGTHILACHAGRPYDDTYTFNQAPPSVVHWFGWPEDAAGFYLSVALGDQKTPFDYTHWKPLGAEPCDTKRLDAEAARHPLAAAQLVCDHCGVDRLKQACGEPHRPDGCRFTGNTLAATPPAAQVGTSGASAEGARLRAARAEEPKPDFCPHAHPFVYCETCVANPCPLSLGEKK